MSLDMIMDAISRVGFPIAIAIILLWYIQKITQQHHDDLMSMEERHRADINTLKASIDANTSTMSKLLERGDNRG